MSMKMDERVMYQRGQRKTRIERIEQVLSVLAGFNRDVAVREIAFWIGIGTSSHLRSMLEQCEELELVASDLRRASNGKMALSYRITKQGMCWYNDLYLRPDLAVPDLVGELARLS